jgi:hypothetical protein
MKFQRGNLTLWVPLLLAAAAPLHAQFTTAGCPQGPSGPQLSGFTAGTPGSSQICLSGTFGTSLVYNVTLTDMVTLATAVVQGTASSTQLVVIVPPAFYPLTSSTQPDPVTINITPPAGTTASPQNGTFQTNPPLQAATQVFLSAVNTPVTWTMYSGGTQPYQAAFVSGTVPQGMPSFPTTSPVWGGTPTQSGVFSFSITAADGWNNAINPTIFIYVPPKPQITNTNPQFTVVGPATSVLINGSGFVSPASVGGALFPGSSVLWTQGTNTVTLTPTSFSATQLTVNLPANLLTATGGYAFVVLNPGPSGSNGVLFDVDPSITGLSTYTRTVGTSAFPLTVTGTGFVNGSTVETQTQVPLPTTFVNSTTLTATFPSESVTGSVPLIVVNPDTTVTPVPQAVNILPAPTVTSLKPASANAGGAAFALTVSGAQFLNGMTVYFNSNPVPTTLVQNQQNNTLVANVPASAILTAGVVPVTVVTTDGYTTPPLNFTIQSTVKLLTPSSLPSGVVNTPYNCALTATGGTVPYQFAIVGGALPPGLQLSSGAISGSPVGPVPTGGIISGTPTVTGTFAFTVRVTDSIGNTTSGTFNITIAPQPAPQLTTSPAPAGVVNTPYTFALSATGGAGGNTFSVANGTLPQGLQLSSGVIAGTPTTAGSFTFTIQVTDSAGNYSTGAFTIRIAPAPLTFTTGPLSNTQVNTAVSVQFAGTGGIPPYTFVEFGALPPGIQMSSSGLLSGTPTKAGAYPFQVFLDDTTGAYVSKNFTLNVALPGLLITPPSPLPSGQINVPYTTQLAATGGAGAPFTWSATGLPNGLTIANNSGLIAGIPRASGSFNIAVTVGDSSGATDTQTYALTIAPAVVTVTNGSLANGAVGNSYSATVTASGGLGTFTFTATGLPPGLTLSAAGGLSGTPTTAGTFSIVVTATDAAGNTASGTFRVTIAPQLVVTPSSIPGAVVGNAISPVQLTATGGTPPYQWQSANLPPGLTLALNGTLSGTPSAAGTFPFTVLAVDSNGALASGTESLTVALPTGPAATIGGLPPSTAPATQQFAQVSLANPYPATLTANLTLTFAPTSGADDPAIQFSTGGRTAQITIPAGSTAGVTNVGVQTGTVAGTITITAQLLAGTANVTPTPAPSQTIQVTAGAPVITSVTAARTSTGFTVSVTGFASNRDVDSGTFQFSASEGSNLQTTQLSTTDTPLFTTWYGTSTSAPFGSQFTLSQPFTVNGSSSAVLSVTVTLTNALGTSPAATAILQ